MEAEPRVTAKPLCKAQTKSGNPCKGKATADGLCMVHTPSRSVDLAEAGRKGGRKSATVKRARAEERRKLIEQAKGARELLRREFETDEEWLARYRDVYREGLIAVDESGIADFSERRQTAEALTNQLYGKPVQNIQTKTDVTITVVSRLDAALETHADVELPESDVTELEA